VKPAPVLFDTVRQRRTIWFLQFGVQLGEQKIHMVSKLRGNAVVSNKDSKHLFLCRTSDNRRYALYRWEQNFCKTDRHLAFICNTILVVLLALLILGRFHHLLLLALPIFIFCFLFLEALDTFFILFTGILTFSFSCSCTPFIASFPIKRLYKQLLFPPLQTKSTRCDNFSYKSRHE